MTRSLLPGFDLVACCDLPELVPSDSRATLATSVSLLGMLLMIGWPVHWVVSGEKGQTKDPDADVPNELSPRTITLHEINITLSNDIRELAN